jgi:hypothetical protein
MSGSKRNETTVQKILPLFLFFAAGCHLGPPGVGKSFIACALAQKACRDGYSFPLRRRSTPVATEKLFIVSG